jgi:alpha-amylase
LIYSDAIGTAIAELGFRSMYVDGIEKLLKGSTPNALYCHPDKKLQLMPRNYRLSDDIAFRYSDRSWSEWPLTGKKFESWISSIPLQQQIVNLAMDYETFGEHKKAGSGIFEFLEDFIMAILDNNRFRFVNPSEASRLISPSGSLSSSRAVSWADEARDLSAWLGNNIQLDAFDSLYKLHDSVLRSGNRKLIETYRHLQTSDHFYYMATKKGADDTVHQYFSPYNSPYEAFMNFMNVITDLEWHVKKRQLHTQERMQKQEGILAAHG